MSGAAAGRLGFSSSMGYRYRSFHRCRCTGRLRRQATNLRSCTDHREQYELGEHTPLGTEGGVVRGQLWPNRAQSGGVRRA